MKLNLLFFFFFGVMLSVNSQILSEDFDNVPNLTSSGGWVTANLSSPVGSTTWMQGTSSVFSAYSGAATSFLAVNYNSTSGAGTIDNWLFTPVVSLQNGNTISFWTRIPTPGATVYPDRLEVRLSTSGSSTIISDFSTVMISINPTLTTTGYPTVWTQYSHSVNGVASATDCRVAFRYWVTDGGPTGNNSNYIGIDELRVLTGTASVDESALESIKIFPNPTSDFINIELTKTSDIQVIDITGKVIYDFKLNEGVHRIELNNLAQGIYYLNTNGVSEKIIKK